jgi:spermidine/putrescine transport system permease protein
MKKIAQTALLGSLFFFLYAPILILVINGFNQSRYGIEWHGFTLKWYQSLWHNHGLMEAMVNSITVGITAATIATMIGTLTAVALFRHQFKGKQIVNSLLFIIISAPDIIFAIALLAVFLLLGMPLGFWSLLIAHTTFCLPFVVISVSARLNDFDYRVIEAATDLGATESKIFWKILVPMAFPAILSSWLLSFALSLDDVIISSFITGPNFEILPIKIYSMVKLGVSPEVNALTSLILVFSLGMVFGSYVLNRYVKEN